MGEQLSPGNDDSPGERERFSGFGTKGMVNGITGEISRGGARRISGQVAEKIVIFSKMLSS
jgi:hypothetical protein